MVIGVNLEDRNPGSTNQFIANSGLQFVLDDFREVLEHKGHLITLRLTGELGRSYTIRTSDTLPMQDNPVWFGQLQNRHSGFRGRHFFTDTGVSGLLRQFYQAGDTVFIPPAGTP